MPKYHVNPNTGEVSQCTAQPGNCPFGGEEIHKDNFEDAQQLADSINEENIRRRQKAIEIINEEMQMGVDDSKLYYGYVSNKLAKEVLSPQDYEKFLNFCKENDVPNAKLYIYDKNRVITYEDRMVEYYHHPHFEEDYARDNSPSTLKRYFNRFVGQYFDEIDSKNKSFNISDNVVAYTDLYWSEKEKK